MSHVDTIAPGATTTAHGGDGHDAAGHNGHGAHAHPPHLAHHFDTPEQQFQSGKLGMWVFLATEILMFGGLFCAYSVYRHNHPDVFQYAHQYLDKILGGINTVVLITSSLTMAWGVRAAQLGQQKKLLVLLALTLLGGFGFMAIKSVEYRSKWDHHLWIGEKNIYRQVMVDPSKAAQIHEPGHDGSGSTPASGSTGHAAPAAGHGEGASSAARATVNVGNNAAADAAHGPPPGTPPTAEAQHAGTIHSPIVPLDPNAGTGDEAKIKPPTAAPAGLAPEEVAKGHGMSFDQLDKRSKDRVNTFFSIYFLMTGLHGLHVVIGMALIYWVMVKAGTYRQAKWFHPLAVLSIGLFFAFVAIVTKSNWTLALAGVISVGSIGWLAYAMTRLRTVPAGGATFGPDYYTPVDIVGLYWHLVDLIWIFLFPLLYLIH